VSGQKAYVERILLRGKGGRSSQTEFYFQILIAFEKRKGGMRRMREEERGSNMHLNTGGQSSYETARLRS